MTLTCETQGVKGSGGPTRPCFTLVDETTILALAMFFYLIANNHVRVCHMVISNWTQMFQLNKYDLVMIENVKITAVQRKKAQVHFWRFWHFYTIRYSGPVPTRLQNILSEFIIVRSKINIFNNYLISASTKPITFYKGKRPQVTSRTAKKRKCSSSRWCPQIKSASARTCALFPLKPGPGPGQLGNACSYLRSPYETQYASLSTEIKRKSCRGKAPYDAQPLITHSSKKNGHRGRHNTFGSSFGGAK